MKLFKNVGWEHLYVLGFQNEVPFFCVAVAT